MSKRAAIIITNAPVIEVTAPDENSAFMDVPTSEQLLADLRLLVHAGYEATNPDPFEGWRGMRQDAVDAAARVRALLPEEGEDE